MAVGITIDRARAEDVAAIVAMLADDELGARREDPGDPRPNGHRRAATAFCGPGGAA
ncbi:hypothetical protein [Nocardiopsis akebiae]|uniref:hypothetical protein n=1 Tax=Nocardiopsis akebiae TaxID=2831968 RepID=UPI002015F505|nr:hypothetical protein [Nocardiopsis akebiae]